jgi:drug/metabolite transporter (DMT)-like permease
MAWTDVLLVIVTMATTCAGHGVMVYALSMAPASTLQPFNYFSLPWAIFLSATIFGHFIDPISLVGAGIIVAAGLVVMARERKRKVAVVTAGPVPGRE